MNPLPTHTPVLFPWATVAGLGVGVAMLALLPAGELRRGAIGRWWGQLAVALTTLALAMFSEAVTRGWVLSQAHLLLAYAPWKGAPLPAESGFSNPLLTDAALQGYPWLAYTCRAFGEGRVPLWVSQSYAGAPFVGPAMTAVFSPLTWAACLAPLPWATVALALLKMVSCGLGMAALARALGATRPAAAVVAVAGTLNPFLVVWLENASDSVAAAAPWVLAATVRASETPSRRAVAGLALTMGWLFVAGQPQTAFAVAVCAAVLGLALAARHQHRWRVVAALAVAAVAGAAVAAAQLVPFVEYLRESRVYAERAARAVNVSYTPARALVTAVAPDFFGNPASGPTILLANAHAQPTNYVEQVAYPGVTLLVLAGVGLACGRRRAVLSVAGIGAVALALKFGAPGALQVASTLPLLRVSPLGRFGLAWMLAVAALAALGLHALTRRDAPPALGRVLAGACSVLVLAGTLCAAWLWLERHGLRATGLWRPTVMHCAALLGVGTIVAALALARARQALPAVAFAVSVSVVLAAELLAFGRGFRPMTPPALVYPPHAAIDAMRSDDGLFRVAGWGSALLPNTHLVYGLSQYRGYDGMNQRRYGALVDASVGREWDLWMDRPFQDSPVLDLLNVKYVLAPPGTPVESPRLQRVGTFDGADLQVNTRVLPRAWLVEQHVVAGDAEAVRLLASGALDPRRTVVLPPETGSGLFSGHAADSPAAREDGPDPNSGVQVLAYRDEEVTLEVTAPAPRWLVLSDLYYPGWEARLDGQPVPILRANHAFRAVRVPAGRHRVQFAYHPASVRAGAAVSLATLLALAALAWRSPS